MTILTTAGIFLIGLLFDLYIILLMLRFLLQKLGANYYNPVSQLLLKMTNIFVLPLRRIIPGYKGFDFAIVFLLILFGLIEAWLSLWMRYGTIPHLGGTLIMALGALGDKLVNLYFYAIILRAIISWISTLQQSPIAEVVLLLTEPLLRPVRRLMPLIGGFDLSTIPVLVVLSLFSIVVFNPIVSLGTRLALTG